MTTEPYALGSDRFQLNFSPCFLTISHNVRMEIRLRSPLARAVLPVAGGLLFFAVLFGVTWLMATFATERSERQVVQGARTFVVGQVTDIAESIAKNGPILYPDLRDINGKRSIVIEHYGTDPLKGWQVYYAYPADKSSDCLVSQIQQSHVFTDCDGRTLKSNQLQKPSDVTPIIEARSTLLIDLQG